MKWTSTVRDVVVALGVTAISLSGSIGEAHPTVHATASQLRQIRGDQPGAAYALVVIGGLVLIWRRRWPLAVLTACVAATTAYAAAGYVDGAALSAVYVALFTVAILESRTTVIAAGVVSLTVLAVATGIAGPFGWIGGTNTAMLPFGVAAVALGLAVAGRRQVFAAMVERAERAEQEREEEAHRRVDAERLRIARELHDVVAHSMSMINVQAGVAVHVMATQPEQAVEALTAIKVASREGLRELRAILNVLRQVDTEGSDRTPAPRLSQLDALAAATTQAGLPTIVRVSGRGAEAGAALPASVELAAYRIVQESLTNVLRHAGPDVSANVRIIVGKRKLAVLVEDDGQGAVGGWAGGVGVGSGVGVGAGTGISGMRERVAAFGGKIRVGPRASGTGWRVWAILPLPSGSAAQADGLPAGTEAGAGAGAP